MPAETPSRPDRNNQAPLVERMVSTQVEKLMVAIQSQDEYSEEPGRANGLAEIYAVLLTLRYAIEKGHLPELAEATARFLRSVNPDRN